MRRREFITLVGGGAIAWPFATRARQSGLPMVGLLSGARIDDASISAIRKGLSETGLVEGKNFAIVLRSADGQYDRLPALAADFVDQNVAVIIAISATAAAVSAKATTSLLPIVFVNGGDPVALGLVASLGRPSGNVTGITFLTNTLGSKRLELLHDIVPSVQTIGFLVNPSNSNAEAEGNDLHEAARRIGVEVFVEDASNTGSLKKAIKNFRKASIGGLIVEADAYYRSVAEQVVEVTSELQVPVIYSSRQFVEGGGLMGYGTSLDDALRLGGVYAGRILKGEKPANLPVQQSVKVQLFINLKTAKALGLSIPPGVLSIADKVIE